MKKLIISLTLAAMAACPLAGFAQADIQQDPAYLPLNKIMDLKATPPQVDVNLPRFMLKEALSSLNTTNLGNSGANVADLADLIKDVKLIRVLVFEGSHTNRAALAKSIKTLRDELDDKWTAMVNVKSDGDHVGIYVKGDATGDSMAGLAVLVHSGDDGDTVIVNVVGHVALGKLMKLATQKNMFPKDLLKQLSSAGVMQGESPKEKKSGGGGGSGGSQKSPESPDSATKDPATK